MSDNKKVLYIEKDNAYPFTYTNSRAVCNLLNSKSDRYDVSDQHTVNEFGVLDLDEVKCASEDVYEVFNSTIKDLLDLINCEIIWVESAEYELSIFKSKVALEHQTEVE